MCCKVAHTGRGRGGEHIRPTEGDELLECGQTQFSLHCLLCLQSVQMHLHHMAGQALGRIMTKINVESYNSLLVDVRSTGGRVAHRVLSNIMFILDDEDHVKT